MAPNLLTIDDLTDDLTPADAAVTGALHLTGPGGLTARAEGTVSTAHTLRAKADLAWEPEFRALSAGGADVTAALGLRALVRSDNGAPIGVVGRKYESFSNASMFDLADSIAQSAGGALTFGSAGHKRGGALPFVQLRMPARVGRVETETLISLFSSHDGSLKFTAGFSRTVIVCRNTYAHALGDASNGVQIRHTASGVERLACVERIARASCAHAAAWDNAALRMMQTRMTDAQAHALVSHLYPGESGKAQGARRAILDAYQSSPGAMPGTAWGAAQAVTHYTTHTLGSEEARAITSITGQGTGADVQAAAWWALDVEPEVMAQRLQTVTLYAV